MLWIILAVLAFLALLQALIEPFLLRISYEDLPLSEAKRLILRTRRTVPPEYPREKLPAVQAGKLRLLFFSDLHVNHLFLPGSVLLKKLFRHSPDVLVFGGDLISRKHQSDKGLSLLKMIVVEAAKKSIPVFVIRGNHDASISDDEFRQCDVILLKNSGLRLKFKARCQDDSENEYLLLGLDDRRTGTVDKELAKKTTAYSQTDVLNSSFKHSRLRFEPLPTADQWSDCKRPYKTLIFAHNPDTVLGLSQGDGDCFFAGHFHGGQIRLPFRLEFKSLRGETLSQEKHYSGFFIRNGLLSFISCGVGCVLFPFRFFSLPEINVFDI